MLQTGNGTHQQKEELHEKLLTRTLVTFRTEQILKNSLARGDVLFLLQSCLINSFF